MHLLLNKDLTKFFCKKAILLFFVLMSSFIQGNSQDYFGVFGLSTWRVNIDSLSCGCSTESICNLAIGLNGLTYSPDSILYGGTESILQINPLTCFWYWTFNAPPGTLDYTYGFVTLDGTIFYTMDSADQGDTLYAIDIISGTITNLGSTGYPLNSELCLYNGEIYYLTFNGIVHLNVSVPSNSELIPTMPLGIYYGLTASRGAIRF